MIGMQGRCSSSTARAYPDGATYNREAPGETTELRFSVAGTTGYDVIVIGTSQGGRFLPVDLAKAWQRGGARRARPSWGGVYPPMGDVKGGPGLQTPPFPTTDYRILRAPACLGGEEGEHAGTGSSRYTMFIDRSSAGSA